MLFFGKPGLILYLKRNSLELYKNGEKTADVTYPENCVNFLEIANPMLFGSFLLRVLPPQGQNIIIVLSADMVFQKVFPRKTPAEEETEIQNFIEKIPFDLTKIEIKKIANDRQLAIVAITKNLYQPVKDILVKAGFTVDAVVPASIFGDVSEETSLNNKDIWPKVLDNKILATGNFLK